MASDHRTAGYKTKLNYKDERKQLFHLKKIYRDKRTENKYVFDLEIKNRFPSVEKENNVEKFIFKLNNRDQTSRWKNVNANGIIKKKEKQED